MSHDKIMLKDRNNSLTSQKTVRFNETDAALKTKPAPFAHTDPKID